MTVVEEETTRQARRGFGNHVVYVQPGAYEEPCIGSCAWCGKKWRGTAQNVIVAQAEHREVCEQRPAPQRYTLEQKRKMHKQGRSAEKIREAEVRRNDHAARATARDEKARKEHAAKAAYRERNVVDQKLRDDAIAALFHEGHSYRAIAEKLNAAGVRPARVDAWESGSVGGTCKRLGLRRGSGVRPRPETLAAIPVIKQLRAEGLGQSEIAAELNRRGVPTPSGTPWNRPNVTRLLLPNATA